MRYTLTFVDSAGELQPIMLTGKTHVVSAYGHTQTLALAILRVAGSGAYVQTPRGFHKGPRAHVVVTAVS